MQEPERFTQTSKKSDKRGTATPGERRRKRADVRALLAASPDEVFARCRGPRYWPVWLFALWLRVTAALPWRFALALHKALGRFAGAFSPRRRRIVRRNLELCFPTLSPAEREAVLRDHFANVGAFFAELAVAWYQDADRRSGLFTYEGVEHLQQALEKGRGVLLYTGHFTPLEICGAAVKPLVPLYAFMFRQRRNPLLDALQRQGRRSYAHIAVTNDNVRTLLKLLGRNAVVWYAPDRARIDNGELIPFFGVPAMTSTAPSRLAKLSGAIIVPMFFRRRADDSGYVVRFHAPLPDLPSEDAARDTVRLNGVLESFIRECPEQYFWTHRKFKDRPDTADIYEPD